MTQPSATLTLRTAVLLLLCIFVVSSCSRRRGQVETIEEPAATLASIVHVADPAAATQLIRGFYDVEGNSWRWTQGKFSVALRPPAESGQKGARLVLRFSIPEPVIQRLKSVVVTATVDATALPSETYTKEGEQIYRQDVPPGAFSGPAATVDFTLDKTLPAGSVDQRELGVVVTSIGFESK